VSPVESATDGIRIRLHIQPRAARTELAGAFGDALRIRLKSPPVDGAANDELIRFLAEALEVPRSRVDLVAGHAARRKTVRVTGIGADLAARRLGLATG
jgi:uncharacterized protein